MGSTVEEIFLTNDDLIADRTVETVGKKQRFTDFPDMLQDEDRTSGTKHHVLLTDRVEGYFGFRFHGAPPPQTAFRLFVGARQGLTVEALFPIVGYRHPYE